jgi:sugar/nucleoside kinase (ribokinase family)
VLGLDGCIDRIAHRAAGPDGAPLDTMDGMAHFLDGRHERSATLTLAGVQARPGGNMPNTALALTGLGVECTCVGTLGYPHIAEAFMPLAEGAHVVSFGEPGFCLALEFDACKLFLADSGGMAGMTWDALLDRAGEDRLKQALEGADVLALLNWGEIPEMRALWRAAAEGLLPPLGQKPRYVFCDTADMTHRSAEDIRDLLETLALFRRQAFTVLSLNDGELASLTEKAGLAPGGSLPDRARALYQTGCVDLVAHHSLRYASVFSPEGEETLATRLAEHPVLLTGGGDNFNAGYLLGMLAGLDPRGCLMTGNAASSCYVRTGRSASLDEIMEEIGRCAPLWADGNAVE